MSASSSILGKIFNKGNDSKKDSTIFYNFLLMISVFIGWGVLYIIEFSFDVNVLWYSVLFAVCYTACNIGIINALKYSMDEEGLVELLVQTINGEYKCKSEDVREIAFYKQA